MIIEIPSEMPSFRNTIEMMAKLYQLEQREAFTLREIPLVIQNKSYVKITMEEEECKRKCEYNEIPSEKVPNHVNIDTKISSEMSSLRNSIEMMAILDQLEQYEATNLRETR